MNRAQRRAEEAKAKMAANADRLRSVIAEGHNMADQLDRMKMLLFAYVREHGRIRVKYDHMKALTEASGLTFVQQENGDIMVQYGGE